MDKYLKINFTTIYNWVLKYGMLLLVTVIFFWIGSKIIKMILGAISKTFKRTKLSEGLESFLISFIRIILFSILFIMSASLMGFPVTSLVTLLGTSGLTIGLALQGSLSNLAGGVLILILKPFDVGDYIHEKHTGQEGTVKAIDIFYTHLVTYDNKEMVIPNGNLSNTTILNYTKLGERMVEIKVSISYSDDIRTAKAILEDTARGLTHILKDRDIKVYVAELGESGVTMGLRYMVKSTDFIPSSWEANERIKLAFDENGITIPFNQLDVHMQ